MYKGDCIGSCRAVTDVIAFQTGCKEESVNQTLQDSPRVAFGFDGEVKEYMEMLQEEDPTKYEAHFSKYIEAGIDAEKMEDMYTEAHEKIREDPDGEKAEKKDISYERDGDTMKASDGTEHTRSHKITLEQRREKVLAKIAAAQAKMMEE